MTGRFLGADASDVCDQLSAALGWRLDFVDSLEEASTPAAWSTALQNDDQPLGRLRLRPEAATSTRAAFSVAVATARAVSHLLQRLHATRAILESRSKEIATLLKLSRTDSPGENLAESLQRLLTGAADLTGMWGSALFLIDPVKEALQLRQTWRVDAARIPYPQRRLDAPSPDAQALVRGAILLERQNERAAEWLPPECSFALGVPISCKDGPLGTLWCYERRRRPVPPRSVPALQSVAAQIAQTLERTVLQRESAHRKRLRSELRVASRHQERSRTWPLQNRNVEIALRSATASELTGDLCELFPLDHTRTFLAMGDAVGHSIPAAMVMAAARGALRALWHEGNAEACQPQELISQLNRTLCAVTASEQFMSLVAGVLDDRARTLTYANAGHPPPWLLRNGVRIALKSHGMLCGVLPQAVYQQSVVALEPGDLLVFFTDGISEALSPQRQLLRADGVLDALSTRKWSHADDAADAIWARLQQHVCQQMPVDDQTLMVIHVRPTVVES